MWPPIISLVIGATTWQGRKSPSAALRNLFYFSSQPDGSPDYVTSVSLSEPAMDLPPVYVDGQSWSEDATPKYHIVNQICARA